MCLTPIRVKSNNPNGLSKAFVPCGHCKQCREASRSAWSIRLSLELQQCQDNGWLVGFITLTYNDACLPHLPKHLCSDSVPCFDKDQVREFIVNLRRDLCDDYNVTGLRYMVCSEYGSHTQRPHYHAIFSWSPEVFDSYGKLVGGCSSSDFFALIKKHWKYGFVFPKDEIGGFDSHGYCHHPFLVRHSARFRCYHAGGKRIAHIAVSVGRKMLADAT